MEILWLAVVGLIVGAVARFLVPGRNPMSLLGTMALGIVGSFVGGFLVTLLTTGKLAITTAGWVGSILGGVLVLLFVRSRRGRIL